jgi:broad specificity phosphatase PhoE
VQLALLFRHGQSLLNVDNVINGDPARDRGLSALGAEEADSLAHQLAGVEVDLCITSRFLRAQQTAERALAGRDVPRLVDPDLDDIRIGELEGLVIDDYETWKRAHTRDDPFPGSGESLNDAARRYADAFARVLERPERVVVVACHEIPVRYAVNAAALSDQLDGPVHRVENATPYLFDADALGRAVDQIRRLAATEHVEHA